MFLFLFNTIGFAGGMVVQWVVLLPHSSMVQCLGFVYYLCYTFIPVTVWVSFRSSGFLLP